MNIFHNAGVTSNEHGKFYKANYINSLPYNEELKITPNTASWHYWNWIRKTKQKSVLL
jgi:hypothetical protein